MVDAAHLWCRESVDSGGGLAGWQRDDLLLEEGAVELPEGEFNAAFNPEAVVKVTDVLLASHENTAQIIDARPAARLTQKLMNLAQFTSRTYSRSTECSVDGTGARRRTKNNR